MQLKEYFNSPIKTQMLLYHGKVALEKIAKKLKINLRNIDNELLLKRLLVDCTIQANKSKSIEALEIVDREIDEPTMKVILETFYFSNYVSSINFSGVHIKGDYGEIIADFFYHNNKQIKSFTLQRNNLKVDTLESIYNALIYCEISSFSISLIISFLWIMMI